MKTTYMAKFLINSRPGLAPADPTPILDQIEISIWKGFQADSIYPIFAEHFGLPTLSEDGRALHWKKHRIAMGKAEKWAYRIIRLQADKQVLAKLSPILKIFPCRPDGKPAAQLRSAEIAWDFPISHNYEEAEAALRKAATAAIPANKRAKLRVRSSDNIKACTDGAANGKLTFYFGSLSKHPDPEDENLFNWVPSKNAIWRGKIYCKQISPGGAWGIRFETTILGPRLAKTIGKVLPSDLPSLSGRLTGLCFDDFWSFERFHWELFIEAAERSAEHKKIPPIAHSLDVRLYSRLAKLDAADVVAWQRLLAKKIARKVGSAELARRIGAGEFSTPCFFEDLSKPD